MSAQKSKNSVPDFAYPKQVIKDADAMLDKALRAGDGTAVVNALIRSGLAQTAISPDSLPSVIYRIEGIAAKEKNAVTHALLDLLLADIYTQYYDGDSYNLNRRPALATPGSDITLWSGKEFKDRIVELYNHALTHAAALKKRASPTIPQSSTAIRQMRYFTPRCSTSHRCGLSTAFRV